MRATLRLNSSLLSRHILAASMLAGDSSLGEESMEMMLIMMDSTWEGKCRWWVVVLCAGMCSNRRTVCTGLQRSAADS